MLRRTVQSEAEVNLNHASVEHAADVISGMVVSVFVWTNQIGPTDYDLVGWADKIWIHHTYECVYQKSPLRRNHKFDADRIGSVQRRANPS